MSYIVTSVLSLAAGAFLWAKYSVIVKAKIQKDINKTP